MRTLITLTELSPTAASGKLYFLADQSDTWVYIWHERGSRFTTRHNQSEKLFAFDISATDQQLLETVTQLLDQHIGQAHTKEGLGLYLGSQVHDLKTTGQCHVQDLSQVYNLLKRLLV